MNLPKLKCRLCGDTKAIILFPPAERKLKRPRCAACISVYNKSRRVGNPVPCDLSYSFNANLEGKL